MKTKIKPFLVLILICLHFFQNKYIASTWFSIDFTYLIIIFVALKSSILKTGFTATSIGLMNDFLSGGILGVFGFSRTLISFIVKGLLVFIDLKKGFYVFMIITISLSASNLMSNFLMYLILDYPINLSFVLLQPVFTGLTGYFILKSSYIKKQLDVY